MRILLIFICAALTVFSSPLYSRTLVDTAYAQQKPIPPYAKWGQLAVKETQKKYPNARVVDYLHIGKVSGQHTSTEKFKLWLKGTQKEFGVFVNIEFNNETEKIINITLKETPR
ncbi:YqzG/YhdC family protein [Neobacillus niacini]|uniref:YqzG/YhdC family protein n=1 Tax=Neobacillus niacini TaxID=86668 RepID=UPI002FFD7268